MSGTSYPSLLEAARTGDIDTLRDLAPKSDLKQNDSEALRTAALWGHSDIVRFLLPLSDHTARQYEALRWAAGKGYTDVVREFLCHDKPVSFEGKQFALFDAGLEGRKDTVRLLANSLFPRGLLRHIIPMRKRDNMFFMATCRKTLSNGHMDFALLILPLIMRKKNKYALFEMAIEAQNAEFFHFLHQKYPLTEKEAVTKIRCAVRGFEFLKDQMTCYKSKQEIEQAIKHTVDQKTSNQKRKM